MTYDNKPPYFENRINALTQFQKFSENFYFLLEKDIYNQQITKVKNIMWLCVVTLTFQMAFYNQYSNIIFYSKTTSIMGFLSCLIAFCALIGSLYVFMFREYYERPMPYLINALNEIEQNQWKLSDKTLLSITKDIAEQYQECINSASATIALRGKLILCLTWAIGIALVSSFISCVSIFF